MVATYNFGSVYTFTCMSITSPLLIIITKLQRRLNPFSSIQEINSNWNVHRIMNTTGLLQSK